MDYAVVRKRMVQEQLVGRGIRDPRVLDAFEKVERHRFVPPESIGSSYADFPVAIGEGQTISQPYMVALMTECLELKGVERILEIGTGSGYQTAVLSLLAKEVFSIERIEALAQRARRLFDGSGYANIKSKTGDGTLGWPEEAPFDRIIITAASPHIPLPLSEQLKERGKLVLPLGDTFSQVLTLVDKEKGKLDSVQVCPCVFVPLVGKFGWKQ
jgi:protein-L-isoaspartate(D-aspartate) O-methyltransferase